MHAPHVIVVSDLLTYVSPYIDAIIIISYTEVMIFFCYWEYKNCGLDLTLQQKLPVIRKVIWSASIGLDSNTVPFFYSGILYSVSFT